MSVAGAVAWPSRTIWWPRWRRATVAGAPAGGVAAVVAALREALNTPTEDADDLSASGNHPLAMIGGSTAPRGHRALQPEIGRAHV